MANHKNITMPSKQAATNAAGTRNKLLAVYGKRYTEKTISMNKVTWNALDKTILKKIEKMDISGSSVKDILNYLVDKNTDDRLLGFYLEAIFGKRLTGSVYTSKWSRESEKHKEDILWWLEASALDAKAERDIGGEITSTNIAMRLNVSEQDLDNYLDICPEKYGMDDGRKVTAESYFWIKKEIEKKMYNKPSM